MFLKVTGKSPFVRAEVGSSEDCKPLACTRSAKEAPE